MAVVTAVELDHPGPARGPPGQPQGAHGRFRAGVDQAHHVKPGHRGAEDPGQFKFPRRRGPEAGAKRGRRRHRRHHRGRRVAQDQWPPGAHVIQVGVAIHVKDPGPRPAPDDPGGEAHGLPGPHRAVHPSGDEFAGGFKQLFGFFVW